jgi:DNA-binding IclR family transcriptional regulator
MARMPNKQAVDGDSQVKSNPASKEKSDYQIQSVTQALDLLEAVAASADGLSLESLRRQLGFSRETVLRLAANLEHRSYLELDRLTDHYCLSLQTLVLSQTFIHQAALFNQARPIIERLCGETVYIAVLRDKESVYLEHVETKHAVRVVSRFGSRLPAYCSAGGKVLLAGLAPESLKAYLKETELVAYTPTTFAERHALEHHLLLVAAQGFAVNEEELEGGVCGIAAPIRNHAGMVIAAVVISAPAVRVLPHRLRDDFIHLVRTAAEAISTRLGYLPESREEG